jgi:hypothetical protein
MGLMFKSSIVIGGVRHTGLAMTKAKEMCGTVLL